MKICMIGTGYVGLVSGACFADLGNTVYCVDKNPKKIDLLNTGSIPIYEPGLSELVKKNYLSNRLKFTQDLAKAVKSSDIIFKASIYYKNQIFTGNLTRSIPAIFLTKLTT